MIAYYLVYIMQLIKIYAGFIFLTVNDTKSGFADS